MHFSALEFFHYLGGSTFDPSLMGAAGVWNKPLLLQSSVQVTFSRTQYFCPLAGTFWNPRALTCDL